MQSPVRRKQIQENMYRQVGSMLGARLMESSGSRLGRASRNKKDRNPFLKSQAEDPFPVTILPATSLDSAVSHQCHCPGTTLCARGIIRKGLRWSQNLDFLTKEAWLALGWEMRQRQRLLLWRQ